MSEPRIPIANIYYMFCYAWDRFEQAKATAVGAESIQGHPVRIVTIDLAQEWSAIDASLRSLLTSPQTAAAA